LTGDVACQQRLPALVGYHVADPGDRRLGFYMLHNTLQVNATQMAPGARGLAVSLFAFFLFTGQSLGVALGAPVVDRFGARPVFAIAAVVLILIAFWFRARLIRQTAAS
jgi:YNFM family putative membrane transporter